MRLCRAGGSIHSYSGEWRIPLVEKRAIAFFHSFQDAASGFSCTVWCQVVVLVICSREPFSIPLKSREPDAVAMSLTVTACRYNRQ